MEQTQKHLTRGFSVHFFSPIKGVLIKKGSNFTFNYPKDLTYAPHNIKNNVKVSVGDHYVLKKIASTNRMKTNHHAPAIHVTKIKA